VAAALGVVPTPTHLEVATRAVNWGAATQNEAIAAGVERAVRVRKTTTLAHPSQLFGKMKFASFQSSSRRISPTQDPVTPRQ